MVGFPEISMKVCKNASMQVFWVQTFLTQILPGPNFFKLSVSGGLRIFRAFASLFILCPDVFSPRFFGAQFFCLIFFGPRRCNHTYASARGECVHYLPRISLLIKLSLLTQRAQTVSYVHISVGVQIFAHFHSGGWFFTGMPLKNKVWNTRVRWIYVDVDRPRYT